MQLHQVVNSFCFWVNGLYVYINIDFLDGVHFFRVNSDYFLCSFSQVWVENIATTKQITMSINKKNCVPYVWNYYHTTRTSAMYTYIRSSQIVNFALCKMCNLLNETETKLRKKNNEWMGEHGLSHYHMNRG